jgi:hypothetical protein
MFVKLLNGYITKQRTRKETDLMTGYVAFVFLVIFSFQTNNMKKYFILLGVAFGAIILSNCSSAKKTAAAIPKSTYTSGVSTVIMNNCSPCHFANVKTDIDEIIRRIELEPTVKGFMPFKKTAKLSDSTIAVFKKWKEDGLLEN